MGMVMKNKSGYHTVLTDSFLKGIEQTNDPDELKKYLRCFNSLVNENLSDPKKLKMNIHLLLGLIEKNLSIKDKSEMPDGIIARVYSDYIDANTNEDIRYE